MSRYSQQSPQSLCDDTTAILSALEVIEDPRLDRRKLHPLNKILLMALIGVAAGANKQLGANCLLLFIA